MALYYKFLGPNGEAIHGSGKWHLPTKGHPGKWMPKIANPALCERGYHVCEEKDLLEWLRPDCWLVEVRGPEIKGDSKSVFQEGRLFVKTSFDKTAMRLFAADCAERALTFIKDKNHRDVIQRTILVVRAYAFGLASASELKEAKDKTWEVRGKLYAAYAYAAAYAADAAAYAADAAAAAAAYAADAAAAAAAYAAAYAADAAAAAAAYAAAYAARSKARAEVKDWQIHRLIAYIHGRVDLSAIKAAVENDFNQQKGK